MPLQSYVIKPILGLKMDVPQNDATLFQADSESTALCYCIDMQNVDVNRLRRSSSKSTGYQQYTATANANAVNCHGLYELKGSAITDHIYFDEGKFYYLSGDAFINVDANTSDGISFGTGAADLMSVVQVGDYAVFTDQAATLTPYKWKSGETYLTKLIATGTEYKFKYLETFQRRVIGAYSDQTNGDIEIRWTQDWTTAEYMTSACTFAAANQLYKGGNDKITGIKRFGANACFLYGEDSISSLDYLGNYSMPFGLRTVVNNHGCDSHHSIVDVGTTHFFFNRHYGFVGYAGGASFPLGGKGISEPINDLITSINPTYYDRIVGKFISQRNEIVWAVPIQGEATPNVLLFYNITNGQWWRKNINCRYVDFWTLGSTLTWEGLTALGYVYWEDFGMLRWSDLVSNNPYMVHGDTDGHLYTHTGESANGSSWAAWRVEPIISLGNTRRSLLLEIWFSLSAVGGFTLNVYYRGGDTVNECERSSWTQLDDVNMDSPDNAVCYTAQNNRYHQIKWGTDSSNEPFSINSIEFKYVPQAEY